MDELLEKELGFVAAGVVTLQDCAHVHVGRLCTCTAYGTLFSHSRL